MSAGITRIHGAAEVGTSYNVTGRKSTFFSGYQPLFVQVQVLTSKFDMTGNGGAGATLSNFEYMVRASEAQGSLVGYGNPANANSSSTAILIFDAASLNQGDGAHGSDTNFGALQAALASASLATGSTAVAGDFAITAYTGFSGAAFAA
jgi:hypothetical protein